MAKSTVDVNVSTLPLVGRTFANRFVFGLDESASDSVRFDSTTLFVDVPLTSVATQSPIIGDGLVSGTPLAIDSNVDASVYVAANQFTTTQKAGTFTLPKFSITGEAANTILTQTANGFATTAIPIQNATNLGLGEGFVSNFVNNELSLKTVVAGTNVLIDDTAGVLTISSQVTGANFAIGTVNNLVRGVYEVDLQTGNVFDLTINNETSYLVRFVNFVPASNGQIIFLRFTVTNAAANFSFENGQLGDDAANIPDNPITDSLYIGFVNPFDKTVTIIGHNYNYT